MSFCNNCKRTNPFIYKGECIECYTKQCKKCGNCSVDSYSTCSMCGYGPCYSVYGCGEMAVNGYCTKCSLIKCACGKSCGLNKECWNCRYQKESVDSS